MPSQLILKKSSVAAKVPLTTDLAYGELALNYEDGKLYYKTAANAIANFRVVDRTTSTSSNSTITPTAGSSDTYEVTALAAAATIAAPSGTPVANQRLLLRIKDNGTARALTWTTSAGAYRAIGVTLPTTTVASKVLYVGCVYNSQDSYWDVIALAQQA
jgi:hypothetical protein